MCKLIFLINKQKNYYYILVFIDSILIDQFVVLEVRTCCS